VVAAQGYCSCRARINKMRQIQNTRTDRTQQNKLIRMRHEQCAYTLNTRTNHNLLNTGENTKYHVICSLSDLLHPHDVSCKVEMQAKVRLHCAFCIPCPSFDRSGTNRFGHCTLKVRYVFVPTCGTRFNGALSRASPSWPLTNRTALFFARTHV